ncbi:hypothetical protein EVAR_13807_1 [Eumeta japonica]|uniref:Uncharacterized protein n=1 Tax=Eumeta variegata TaxID=151549 RepID=A0A4C1U1C1_EUMVA|nr:hypothetical protein EVAR_13807_1 [Eumeta japonica]
MVIIIQTIASPRSRYVLAVSRDGRRLLLLRQSVVGKPNLFHTRCRPVTNSVVITEPLLVKERFNFFSDVSLRLYLSVFDVAEEKVPPLNSLCGLREKRTLPHRPTNSLAEPHGSLKFTLEGHANVPTELDAAYCAISVHLSKHINIKNPRV